MGKIMIVDWKNYDDGGDTNGADVWGEDDYGHYTEGPDDRPGETVSDIVKQYEAEGWEEDEDLKERMHSDNIFMFKNANRTAKRISLDNGHSFSDADELTPEQWRNIDDNWDAITQFMDRDTAESVEYDESEMSNHGWLARYLELAPEDLIFG